MRPAPRSRRLWCMLRNGGVRRADAFFRGSSGIEDETSRDQGALHEPCALGCRRDHAGQDPARVAACGRQLRHQCQCWVKITCFRDLDLWNTPRCAFPWRSSASWRATSRLYPDNGPFQLPITDPRGTDFRIPFTDAMRQGMKKDTRRSRGDRGREAVRRPRRAAGAVPGVGTPSPLQPRPIALAMITAGATGGTSPAHTMYWSGRTSTRRAS